MRNDVVETVGAEAIWTTVENSSQLIWIAPPGNVSVVFTVIDCVFIDSVNWTIIDSPLRFIVAVSKSSGLLISDAVLLSKTLPETSPDPDVEKLNFLISGGSVSLNITSLPVVGSNNFKPVAKVVSGEYAYSVFVEPRSWHAVVTRILYGLAFTSVSGIKSKCEFPVFAEMLAIFTKFSNSSYETCIVLDALFCPPENAADVPLADIICVLFATVIVLVFIDWLKSTPKEVACSLPLIFKRIFPVAGLAGLPETS